GLTSTLPCPIASAASSTVSAGGGTEPEKAGTGSRQPAPIPYFAAVPTSAPSGSCSARAANVVLQECANAAARAIEPRLNESSLCTTRPPRVTVPGQGSTWPGTATWLSSTAVAVMILKVDPAGYWPVSARSNGASALLATARISPVDGRTATIAPRCDTVASACSAAACTARSSVSRTGVPGRPAARNSRVTGLPAASTIESSVVAVPVSWSFNTRCSPDTPSWSPAAYPLPSSLSTSAVAS